METITLPVSGATIQDTIAAVRRRRTPEEKAAQRAEARADRKEKGIHLAPKGGREHPDVPEIVVNRYSQARQAACDVCKVPYGKVFVGFDGSSVRSAEMLPEGGNRTSFIDPKADKQFRDDRRNVKNLVSEWESDPDSVKTPPFPGQGERRPKRRQAS